MLIKFIINKLFLYYYYNLCIIRKFGDWGLWIGDWAQSPIPNPQSPIPKSQNNKYLIY